MRTVDEIKEYLMINNYSNIDIEEIIKDALFIETNYRKDIRDNNYEYALICDFINSPFILEDEDEVDKLELIEQVGGLIVYKPIYKNEEDI